MAVAHASSRLPITWRRIPLAKGSSVVPHMGSHSPTWSSVVRTHVYKYNHGDEYMTTEALHVVLIHVKSCMERDPTCQGVERRPVRGIPLAHLVKRRPQGTV